MVSVTESISSQSYQLVRTVDGGWCGPSGRLVRTMDINQSWWSMSRGQAHVSAQQSCSIHLVLSPRGRLSGAELGEAVLTGTVTPQTARRLRPWFQVEGPVEAGGVRIVIADASGRFRFDGLRPAATTSRPEAPVQRLPSHRNRAGRLTWHRRVDSARGRPAAGNRRGRRFRGWRRDTEAPRVR